MYKINLFDAEPNKPDITPERTVVVTADDVINFLDRFVFQLNPKASREIFNQFESSKYNSMVFELDTTDYEQWAEVEKLDLH